MTDRFVETLVLMIDFMRENLVWITLILTFPVFLLGFWWGERRGK